VSAPTGGGRELTDQQLEDLAALGAHHGLLAFGTCSAHTWSASRSRLEQARATGIAADMAFTYRSPARSSEPQRALRSARTLLVGAWPYPPASEPHPGRSTGPVDTPPRGRVAAYAAVDHYAALREVLERLAQQLRDWRFRSTVVIDSNAVLDKEAAFRSGVGWFGKNSLILVPGHGSWCVLGSVVTDAGTRTVPQPLGDGCGTCTRCVPACPTGALDGAGRVDARRCLAWLVQAAGTFPVEFREALGTRLYGCDDCQTACPPNRLTIRRSGVSPAPGPDLCGLLESGDEEILGRFGAWYIAGRDPDVVRRNALIGLGNSRSEDPRIEGLLEAYAAGPNPLLAEHARWATLNRRSRSHC